MYVLSIAGAVVLMTIADIIMPEGQTAKYIKSALSIFLVLIIISPISNIVKGGINLSKLFSGETISADYSFINKLNDLKASALEDGTEKRLEESGFSGVKVNILYTGSAEGITIDFVHVDLTKLVFNGNDPHINIIDSIKGIVSDNLSITKEKIYTYGAD